MTFVNRLEELEFLYKDEWMGLRKDINEKHMNTLLIKMK
jgi:hypothetical protein